MTKKRKRCGTAALLVAMLLLLAACQAELEEEPATTSLLTTAMTTTAEPATQEETLPERHEPTKEDFIEVLEALKLAFAAGEYQAFADKYPRPRIDESEEAYIENNKWPSLLKGVIAEMTYDTEELLDDFGKQINEGASSAHASVSLDVKSGNQHVPEGRQILRLYLSYGDERGLERPGIYRMSLNTDGRWEPFATDMLVEDQLYNISRNIAVFAHTPLMRSICFLNEFEPSETRIYAEDEIIAAAKKYLGMDYTFAEIAKDREDDIMLSYDKPKKDHYSIVDGCVLGRSARVKYLGANREDILVYRAFIYETSFQLAIRETIDYNYRILENPDGTPYAQLLSVQTVTQP